MLVVLTTGQYNIWRCIKCASAFTGPNAAVYFQAHQNSHEEGKPD